MANYSKESERQNKALKDLMSGKEYEKSYAQVGYEGKQENLGGKTRESELSKTMQSIRMPWFCPKCQKAMKKKRALLAVRSCRLQKLTETLYALAACR